MPTTSGGTMASRLMNGGGAFGTFGGFGFPSSRFTSLQPGTTPGPTTFTGPTTGTGDPYGVLVNSGCNLISNPTARAACLALGGLFGGGGGGGGTTSLDASQAQKCPTGWVGEFPNCYDPLAIFPGGSPFQSWSPVNGRYGAGYSPAPVSRMRLVCPAGHKLGKDNVCYDRIRKGDRKHNPGTKPFLTGGEVAAIRRAKRLRRKFVRLSGGKGALFPMAKKCGPKRRKKA